jgi:hypothetical protein
MVRQAAAVARPTVRGGLVVGVCYWLAQYFRVGRVVGHDFLRCRGWGKSTAILFRVVSLLATMVELHSEEQIGIASMQPCLALDAISEDMARVVCFCGWSRHAMRLTRQERSAGLTVGGRQRCSDSACCCQLTWELPRQLMTARPIDHSSLLHYDTIR